MTGQILISIITLVIAINSTPAFAQWSTAPEADVPPVVFVIEGADASLASETESILNQAHAELYRSSGLPVGDTVRVVYIRKNQSFDSIVGGRFPDWGVAAAIGERQLIVIRSPADFPHGRTIRETLRHELAHLHLDAISGMRQIPRWMHEGYAQQFAHQWVFGDDLMIARVVFVGQAIDLRDIDGVNSFAGSRAQLAYAQSYLAMNHFLSVYGWEGLHLFCEALRDRSTWDDAFRHATGADYAAFQREFDAFLNARYNWVAFLGDTILLWIGLVVAFVIVYVVKRKRSAKRRAEWEQQEAIEDILYGPFMRTDPEEPKPPQSPQ